jgi:hypothetical protein
MDKVTQSNAATAEESASASAELSSQAEAVMESARMLQRLLDGRSGAGTGSTAPTAPAAKAVPKSPETPVAQATALAAAGGGARDWRTEPRTAVFAGKSRGNGNGAADRLPMPMDKEFKDF